MSATKIYFASDFHLGADGKTNSKEREKLIISWLEYIESDATALYLVGDIFDFWFDYKTVVPRGYTRLLGKLAQLSDAGLPIYYFTGNHDLWAFDYFEKELGIKVFHQPIQKNICGKKFFIGHGDGLGPGDYGYKRLKKVFTNRFCQWLFRWIHPDWGVGLANYFSKKSRYAQPSHIHWLGKKKEWLVQYVEKQLDTEYYDYFIFGHRHLTIDHILSNKKSRYINLGEWLFTNSYAVFDGHELHIRFYESEHEKVSG